MGEFETKGIESLKQVMPPDRPEYLKGELPLRFAKLLSNGDVLVAHQDEHGEAVVAIEREGKEVFNFRELLVGKEDVRFETPQSLEKRYGPTDNKTDEFSMWRKGDGVVFMGDWRTSEGLYFFLHEIGHVLNDKTPEADEDGLFLHPMTAREGNQWELDNEKSANSYAREQIVELSNRTGADLLRAAFPGGEEELESFIKAQEGQFEEVK